MAAAQLVYAMRRRPLLLLGLVIPTLAGTAASYNRYVSSQQTVAEAWGQVLNVEQRRFDLVPQLERVTHEYAAYERDLIADLQRARSQSGQTSLTSAAIDGLAHVDATVQTALRLPERYPELHASELFRNLDYELRGTANRIVVERRRYNEAAAKHRALARKLPYRAFTTADRIPPLFPEADSIP